MAKRSKKITNTNPVEDQVTEQAVDQTSTETPEAATEVKAETPATVVEETPSPETAPVTDGGSESVLETTTDTDSSADTPIDPAVLQPEVEVHTGEILDSAPDYVYISVDGIHLDVAFNKSGLNIHVQDSYQLSKKSQISVALDLLMDTEAMANMRAAGFKRSRHSMFIEWAAHNTLYRWGREPERTGSVDIDQSETLGRRFLYYILAMFCPR